MRRGTCFTRSEAHLEAFSLSLCKSNLMTALASFLLRYKQCKEKTSSLAHMEATRNQC